MNVPVSWPYNSREREERELAKIVAEIPDDHASVLIAVLYPTTTPYVNHIAEDAGQTYEHTRICLRNLKYQQLVRISSYVQEDRLGYFGSFYMVTSLGRMVAHRLERMGKV